MCSSNSSNWRTNPRGPTLKLPPHDNAFCKASNGNRNVDQSGSVSIIPIPLPSHTPGIAWAYNRCGFIRVCSSGLFIQEKPLQKLYRFCRIPFILSDPIGRSQPDHMRPHKPQCSVMIEIARITFAIAANIRQSVLR